MERELLWEKEIGSIMDFDDRLVTSEEIETDTEQYSLRPRTLEEYIGQEEVKSNI